jgi:hypothetical protein
MQPCDVRGRVKPGVLTQNATAALVSDSDAEYLDIRRKVKAKYGFMTSVTKLLGQIGGIFKGKRIPYGDVGVVITPS